MATSVHLLARDLDDNRDTVAVLQAYDGDVVMRLQLSHRQLALLMQQAADLNGKAVRCR